MSKLQQNPGDLNALDELRRHLTECERLLPQTGVSQSAIALLTEASAAHTLLDALEAQGVDVRSELVRLQNVSEATTRRASALVRVTGGLGAYAELRSRIAPGSKDPWWRLDEIVAGIRRKRLTWLGALAGMCVLLGLMGYAFRGILFPPDPVGDATNAALRAIGANDLPKALGAIDAGLAITTTNAELLIWRGALGEKLGLADAPRNMAAGRAGYPSQLDFLSVRADIYLRLTETDKAMDDLNAAIQLAPNDPIAYFLRANAWENKQDFSRAMADLDTAGALAEKANNPQLTAMIRIRAGQLMQDSSGRIPTAKP
jgi:tetratricopeptide (TPR) repeat protein